MTVRIINTFQSENVSLFCFFRNMSLHETEKTRLREYLTRAQALVGEKVELKEEG